MIFTSTNTTEAALILFQIKSYHYFKDSERPEIIIMEKKNKKPKFKLSKKAGLSPGSLVHIGEKKIKRANITLTNYDVDKYNVTNINTYSELQTAFEPGVNWINIEGIHDAKLMDRIGVIYGISPLALEDIMNTQQRPKNEDFDNYLLFILKYPYYNEENIIELEQVSLILAENFVISFKESDKKYFEPLENRLKNSMGRVRQRGQDYLFYALLDIIIDNYYTYIENITNQLEDLEDELLRKPENVEIMDIQNHKKEVLKIYKAVFPLKDAIKSVMKNENELIDESHYGFFNDLKDHVFQIVDSTEWLLEMASEQKELYLSNISYRMNEVMKILTIMASIFIPLTFIVGIYGMNFEYMPELHWKYSYYVVWGIMVLVSIMLIMYFKRKKWL